MEIVLTKNVPGLGVSGDVVNVKNGYARNYLMPQDLAVRKTSRVMKIIEDKKEELRKEKEEIDKEYSSIIDSLKEKGKLKISVKVGDGDKLFGTVTNSIIAKALKEKFDLNVDKRQVIIRDVVRFIGNYTVTIRLSKEFSYDLSLVILPIDLN